ncbi:MAG TPA: NnrS family protein [Caulobacteraceae bacterium]
MPTAAARRAYAGPALFSFGFRPFFLLGAAWAALAVPLWLLSLNYGGSLALTRDWHTHEMLFGFLAAIVAGFLTTAVPNWTGRMPVIGLPLVGLAGLWIAGRAAMAAPGFPVQLAAVVDSAFLLVLAAVIWREVLTGRNWRNLPVCGLVSVLALANVAFHMTRGVWDPAVGERMAMAVAAVLIALIGGRIVPSFTRNWMRKQAIAAEPAVFGHVDRAALALTAAAASTWTALPATTISGALLVVAGGANLARLARWRGWLTGREPLVWILHLGYGWLGAGLLLIGLSVLDPLVPRTAGVHALTAGAIGVMTLAVMTRATRGHTGRPLAADGGTLAIYIAINTAALVRVAAPFAGEAQSSALALSAMLWTAAFGGFALVYGSMLTSRRLAAAN